jgi:hypothetical protein
LFSVPRIFSGVFREHAILTSDMGDSIAGGEINKPVLTATQAPAGYRIQNFGGPDRWGRERLCKRIS